MTDKVSHEEHTQMKRRHDSYAQANQEQSIQLEILRSELTRVTADRNRLDAALTAERTNNQLLIEDGNTRYKAANEEVERLRELCKSSGVDPNKV